MEEREYVELRSEDVQEILGTPPGSLVRWGTAVVLAGFALMMWAGYFVRYPDVVEAKVVVTTSVPPVEVIARTEGRIAKLVVGDKKTVRQNAILAVLQSTANYLVVLQLDQAVAAYQRAPLDSLRNIHPLNNIELGELQPEYAEFLLSLENFQFGKSGRSAATRSDVGAANQQIAQLLNSIELDRRSQKRIDDQMVIAQEIYGQHKSLFDQGLESRMDFEKERTKLADLERQHDFYDENIVRKQNEITSLRRGANDATFSQQENASGTSTRLLTSLNKLRSAIDQWKLTYLLTAPIDGQVSLNAAFFSEQQYVKQGDQVMTVVPPQSDTLVGRMSLPIAGSGKVMPGQRVILKFDNYPYHEFGTVRGQVISKALVPKGEQYSIIVSLPDGLRTSHKNVLRFEQQLQGKAEIITDDKSFLERIGEQVFAGR
ncbi:MAG: HlyD family efflux transporter periplasmic adaptor subunit [Saprospiraceae bacterium]